MVREEADGGSLKSELVRETSPGIFPFHVKVFPQGFFSLLCANPVCKSQPIDAVVELGWD